MGVILQAAYRRIVRVNGKTFTISVPCPNDNDTPDVDWWYDHIANQGHELASAGFSAVLLPPVCKTNAGTSQGADGYGVFDDYDIGNKDQFGTIPTRFGTREQLQRLSAVLHANGLDVYVDMVPHQRVGGHNGIYNYQAYESNSGRFPKHASCFFGLPAQGRVPRDPIAGPASDDFSFGDELCTVTSTPSGYVLDNLIDAGDWITQTLDLQGYRIDDTKGQVSSSVYKWATSKSMSGKIAIGEYYDGNPENLNWWVWQSGINGRVYVFDFALHFILQNMCNNGAKFNMQTLDHAGYAGLSPTTAVTFVENPDTDTDGFATIIWNKLLGYAYILTTEGYPTVYYKDYSTDMNCYGLKNHIDNLIWIHENLANGETIYRWKDYQFVVYERTLYPNLLVGLNNDMNNGWKSVKVQTAFGPNVQLHDYSGHAGDIWSDAEGNVTISIPQNDNGLGYVCYSRAGLDKAFQVNSRLTTQVFWGDKDLDIGPATARFETLGRIWCEENSEISVESSKNINWQIVDEKGSVILLNQQHGITKIKGWHSVSVKSKTSIQSFELKITYLSTQTLN